MNPSDILRAASKQCGCNTVKLCRITDDALHVVPGELIGFNRNLCNDVVTHIMSECIRQKKRPVIETGEILVSDTYILERSPLGEYKCFTSITSDVEIDTCGLIAIVYSEDSTLNPRLVSSSDAIRHSSVVQRSVFRFGTVKLVVEIDVSSDLHVVYAEFKTNHVNNCDIESVLRVIRRE